MYCPRTHRCRCRGQSKHHRFNPRRRTQTVEAGLKFKTIPLRPTTWLQILLIDGTAFTVDFNSSVTLDRFIHNPETAEGSLEVTSRGLLRLVAVKSPKRNPSLKPTRPRSVSVVVSPSWKVSTKEPRPPLSTVKKCESPPHKTPRATSYFRKRLRGDRGRPS